MKKPFDDLTRQEKVLIVAQGMGIETVRPLHHVTEQRYLVEGGVLYDPSVNAEQNNALRNALEIACGPNYTSNSWFAYIRRWPSFYCHAELYDTTAELAIFNCAARFFYEGGKL